MFPQFLDSTPPTVGADVRFRRALLHALERERTGQTILLRTADAAEGMRAFAERRTPDFEGK